MAVFQFSRGKDSLRGTKRPDRFSGNVATMLPKSVGAMPDVIINFQASDQIDLPGDWTRAAQPLKLGVAGTMQFSRKGFTFADLKESAIKDAPNGQGVVALLVLDGSARGIKWSGSVLTWIADPQSAVNPLVMLADYRGPVAIV